MINFSEILRPKYIVINTVTHETIQIKRLNLFKDKAGEKTVEVGDFDGFPFKHTPVIGCPIVIWGNKAYCLSQAFMIVKKKVQKEFQDNNLTLDERDAVYAHRSDIIQRLRSVFPDSKKIVQNPFKMFDINYSGNENFRFTTSLDDACQNVLEDMQEKYKNNQ